MRDRRKDTRKLLWWTRKRVLLGLQRLYQETGQAPTGREAYRQLVRVQDGGKRAAERRYPSEWGILPYWSSIAEAWRAAGVEVYARRELPAPASGEALRFKREHEAGERHGRLVVIEFAGHRERGPRDRVALWRCVCDCGKERLVESGRVERTRECEPCALEKRLSGLKRGTQPGPRVAARRQASDRVPSSSLAGAAGAPRATSPG